MSRDVNRTNSIESSKLIHISGKSLLPDRGSYLKHKCGIITQQVKRISASLCGG